MMSRIGSSRPFHAPGVKWYFTPRACSGKAFTLIEVMIAVSILVIGMVGVLRAYMTAISAFEAGRSGIEAASLLKEKMSGIERELIEKRGLPAGTCEGAFEGRDDALRWKTDVRPLVFETEEMNGLLNELELTISDGRARGGRSFRLTTYVDNYAPASK